MSWWTFLFCPRVTQKGFFLRSRHAKKARDSEDFEFGPASKLFFFATLKCDAGAKRQARLVELNAA
jgi:hypothetical protein